MANEHCWINCMGCTLYQYRFSETATICTLFSKLWKLWVAKFRVKERRIHTLISFQWRDYIFEWEEDRWKRRFTLSNNITNRNATILETKCYLTRQHRVTFSSRWKSFQFPVSLSALNVASSAAIISSICVSPLLSSNGHWTLSPVSAFQQQKLPSQDIEVKCVPSSHSWTLITELLCACNGAPIWTPECASQIRIVLSLRARYDTCAICSNRNAVHVILMSLHWRTDRLSSCCIPPPDCFVLRSRDNQFSIQTYCNWFHRILMSNHRQTNWMTRRRIPPPHCLVIWTRHNHSPITANSDASHTIFVAQHWLANLSLRQHVPPTHCPIIGARYYHFAICTNCKTSHLLFVPFHQCTLWHTCRHVPQQNSTIFRTWYDQRSIPVCSNTVHFLTVTRYRCTKSRCNGAVPQQHFMIWTWYDSLTALSIIGNVT